MAVATSRSRLEVDPGLQKPATVLGVFARRDAPAARHDVGQLGAQHLPNLLAALKGPNVPGKGYEIAPETRRFEQRESGVDVALRQRCIEIA